MLHIAHRSSLPTLLFTAVWAACTAGGPMAPAVAPGGAALAPGDTRCPTWGCGSNTPRVNHYPVEALHLEGVPNDEGFSIVPILHAPPGGVPQQLMFNVKDGEIIGKDPASGHEVTGMALQGSWFELRQTLPDGEKREWQVHITRVAKVPLWPVRGDSDVNHYEYVTAYELTLSGDDIEVTHYIDSKLCPEARAWGWDEYKGPDKIAENGVLYRPLAWDEEGRYALIVKGETYSGLAAKVDKHDDDGAPWFNIACAGTALSKMKLMGYDPEEQRFPTTPQQRQAALKMITARYCGDPSFTHDGQPLIWQNAMQWFRPVDRIGAEHLGDVEALWDENGATCLTQPRDPAWSHADVIGRCGHIPKCSVKTGLDSIPDGQEWLTMLRVL